MAEPAIAALAARNDKPETFAVVTYGCQMNARDGEAIAQLLAACGLVQADRADARLLVFNTCCVRDNAERRALGNIRRAVHDKRSRPGMMVAVCGCMAQESGGSAERAFPGVDIVFGTHNIRRLPEYLLRALDGGKPVADIWREAMDVEDVEELASGRGPGHKAFVIATRGCDNFCSYCVVPSVRGRERSRPMDDILRECEGLLSGGVKEITLLGQNVNSYGAGLGDGATFARLLRAVAGLGAPRVRFMTSHPKDLSDELVEVMAEVPAVCGHIHLPVQSGSDRILSLMNRSYGRERYLERLAKLRQAVPDVGVTTDLIVGFPGETDADFEDTLSLVDEAGFDAAYTFIYSPRTGTKAAAMPGRAPDEVSRERITRLIAAQEARTARVFAGLVGSDHVALVDEAARRGAREVSGKVERGISVTLPGGEGLIGRFVPVRIVSAGHNTLRGTIREG
ncbi:MAG: tRNA (N6-isopentenyl adenosine(37)-C2)-methylthiotransferase MiaB [Oscillospiraceae bacterium]|jgi:tRNA-2-methylthio-N6-dimethylallyladenosine synthase|nr:tRNA (N6-isopentenyl adenosine(37)-C2)-methylthiotransferase MiaB [Oscillospiraceae bacterium]